MSARKEKMRDIVDVLDLFNGELTLDDVLNQELPIISGLQSAKLSKLHQSQQYQKGK